MNEIFKDRLKAVDDSLLEAIRAVFDERIEQEKPIVEKTDIMSLVNNELLGAQFRAYMTAKDFIAQSFIDLASYKVNKGQSRNFNKER